MKKLILFRFLLFCIMKTATDIKLFSRAHIFCNKIYNLGESFILAVVCGATAWRSGDDKRPPFWYDSLGLHKPDRCNRARKQPNFSNANVEATHLCA